VESSPGFGGSIVALRRLIEALDPERYTARVAVRRPSHREHLLAGGLNEEQVEVVPLRDGRIRAAIGDTAPFRRLRSLGRSLATSIENHRRHADYADALVRLIESGPASDLVHLNNSVCANMGGILAARRLGLPCVVKQRGYDWHARETRRLAQDVRAFLADSEDVARDIERLGVARERITVTYAPVPTGPVEPVDRGAVRAEFGMAPEVPWIAIFGCLLDWKGQHVFLEAAAKVFQRRPDVRALVVGDVVPGLDHGYRDSLHELAAELGISDRVVFTGHREDVARLMAVTDVCVHASVTPEPFGMVVGEAMALARPVVASDAGGPREMIESGRSGLLAKPGDSDDLASCILRLLDEPEAAASMGAAARERVCAMFSSQRHAELTQAVYDRVLGIELADGDRHEGSGAEDSVESPRRSVLI